MRKSLAYGIGKMIEVYMCLRDFFKSLEFVKTFGEKNCSKQEMKSPKGEGELINNGEEQRLVIEYLLLTVENLEEATKLSSNGDEIPSMKTGKIVDEKPTMEDGKIIEENPSKSG